ncbi:MAG TPA: alpha,alpha-trehalase TreF, partial [Chitinophagaceae bacterium]|nr:alpha,alpha-trehalase TreF [Chitinophagaceae bacterium]
MAFPEIYDLHPLFEDVQMKQVWPDGKTFVDCQPMYSPEEINLQYLKQKDQPGFNLKDFVLANFILPASHSTGFQSDPTKTVIENIDSLWEVLTRHPDTKTGSLIALPYPYIVPGGRFGEIYYWDSYFTMLGLQTSGNVEMIRNMVNNFTFLIDSFGYIPNGNRSYFIGRSQPPFFSLMVKMLAEFEGDQILVNYLPAMEKEHAFWMRGSELLNERENTSYHTVRMPGGERLNRYWDENKSPRPESYAADVELSRHSSQDPSLLFTHLRAGAESGWDYSSRWFREENDFSTIHTTDIVPVDLNCLLYLLETTIAEAHEMSRESDPGQRFRELAENRKTAIQRYCWNEEKGFYFDYDLAQDKQKETWSLAGAYPLFARVATETQAALVAKMLRDKFLRDGGLVTTLMTTGQQWDSPNGWAPLQWVSINGLENYGYHELASETAKRWMRLNTDVYQRTGKLMEKYNVVDTHLEAGGGEYEGQDGFGWTNGVLLALIKLY